MAYRCRDCSYKGKKRSTEGFCPACGSTNFRSATAVMVPTKTETRKGPAILVILLWAYLIGHIYWKLHS